MTALDKTKLEGSLINYGERVCRLGMIKFMTARAAEEGFQVGQVCVLKPVVGGVGTHFFARNLMSKEVQRQIEELTSNPIHPQRTLHFK